MASTATMQVAHSFAAELRERTDALYAGRITHEEHRAANRKTWDAIHAAPQVESEVLRILRQDLPVSGRA